MKSSETRQAVGDSNARPLAPEASSHGVISPENKADARGAKTGVAKGVTHIAPRLINRAVAARRCGISVASFHRHVANKIPRVTIGGRFLYDTADLDRWIDSRRRRVKRQLPPKPVPISNESELAKVSLRLSADHRTGNYMARFTLGGKRWHISTKTTDREEAERVAKRRCLEIIGSQDVDPVPTFIAGSTVKRFILSPSERFTVLERDGFRCRYCGVTAQHARIEIDHVVPRSKGGTDDPSNLVAACSDCNRGKGTRTLEATAKDPTP